MDKPTKRGDELEPGDIVKYPYGRSLFALVVSNGDCDTIPWPKSDPYMEPGLILLAHNPQNGLYYRTHLFTYALFIRDHRYRVYPDLRVGPRFIGA